MAKRDPGKAVNNAITARQPKQHSMVWLQGLLCGAVVTLATPTALLLGVLLGPALLALLFDRQPGRPKARSIALCSMAASIGPLRTLWVADHSMSAAMALLGNTQIIVVAWSAAASGWLLAEVIPVAVRAALEALSISRAARLRVTRATLIEGWGLDSVDNDQ